MYENPGEGGARLSCPPLPTPMAASAGFSTEKVKLRKFFKPKRKQRQKFYKCLTKSKNN